MSSTFRFSERAITLLGHSKTHHMRIQFEHERNVKISDIMTVCTHLANANKLICQTTFKKLPDLWTKLLPARSISPESAIVSSNSNIFEFGNCVEHCCVEHSCYCTESNIINLLRC